MGNRMVRVERVPLGVGEHYVWGEFPDLVSQPLYRLFVHPQGVVAEIPALETDPDHPGGLLSLLVPDALHVLDCLVRLVPKVPGLAALAVRERHHPRLPTSRDRGRNRARGPPHEVARMGPTISSFLPPLPASLICPPLPSCPSLELPEHRSHVIMPLCI